MKVLLVGNYPPDRQESMLRFGAVLAEGLQAHGFSVEYLRPMPVLAGSAAGPAGMGKWLGYVDKFGIFPAKLRKAADQADVVHILDHSNAPYVPHIAHRPHLVTCNDLLAVRAARGEFPEHRPRWSGRVLQRMILGGLRRARRITCISEATRRDVLRIVGTRPERVSVTHMGLNFPYTPSPSPEPKEPFLLHVGSKAWYKNRPGVLGMYRALRGRMQARTPRLVIVGPEQSSAPDGVQFIKDVSNHELQELYSDALLLLFPSLHEGFGWPILEAQACGCPVVTTGRPPMDEVGGDAAFYLQDPMDREEGAALLQHVIDLPAAERAAIKERGLANAARFSTRRMLEEYGAIYRELIETAIKP